MCDRAGRALARSGHLQYVGRSGAVSAALGCGSDPRHHLPGWRPAAPAFEESRGEDPPVCPARQAFCSCDACDRLPASWPTPGSFLNASLVGGSHGPAVSKRVAQLPGTPWGSPGVPVGSCPRAARAHSSLTLAFAVPPAAHLEPALYKDQPSLPVMSRVPSAVSPWPGVGHRRPLKPT